MRGLSLAGDGKGLVGHAGTVLIRALAETVGLTGQLSRVLAVAGRKVVHDRGQVLVDLATVLVLGATAISDITVLRHLTKVFGPTPSLSTAWRVLDELGPRQRQKITDARRRVRHHIWGLLACRPQGFPWIRYATKVLTGWTVIDIDATIVTAASAKAGAAKTFKKTFGFHPLAAWCANTGELLVLALRPGNAGSNTAADHIAVLREAVMQLPAKYRKKILFRIDGAGFSHELLCWIASADGVAGRRWEYSIGWAFTDREEQVVRTLRTEHWQAAVDQDGSVRADAQVADITGLLDLPGDWPDGIRVIVRRERLHPKYAKQASAYEKKLDQRFGLIATNTVVGQVCDLDARHRDHADVEDGVRTAKDFGLRRLPSADWEINSAWCLAVAIAADLTAWLRLFALDGELAGAEPKALRFRLLHLPARLARHARRRILHLPEDWPWTQEALTAWERITLLPVPG